VIRTLAAVAVVEEHVLLAIPALRDVMAKSLSPN
jgi:hypothetical protein